MVKQILRKIIDLIATLEFWYAKKTLKLDRDFILHGDAGLEIKILRGRHKGIVFTISDMKLIEENDTGYLKYKINLVEYPKSTNINDTSLMRYAHNITRVLLSEAAEEKVRDEQRRDVNNIELDDEREVCEEDPSIHEERVSKRKPRKSTVQSDTELHKQVQQPTKRRSNTAIARQRTKSDRTGI